MPSIDKMVSGGRGQEETSRKPVTKNPAPRKVKFPPEKRSYPGISHI
jgi:hypothetical protein